MENLSLQKALKFSGNLYKKSHSWIVGYQKRFFEIVEGRLIYFFDYKKLVAKGLINLRLPGITIKKEDDLKYNQYLIAHY